MSRADPVGWGGWDGMVGGGQASGHALYWKFNCPGKDVKVTHWAEVASISQPRFEMGEGSAATASLKELAQLASALNCFHPDSFVLDTNVESKPMIAKKKKKEK